jgi:F-type H+-transporting ATPase subunit delta
MAQNLEDSLDVAAVYATALYTLAAEKGVVDAVRSELEELVRQSDVNPAFAAFLSSAAVDDDDRERSLEKMFRGRLSDLVLDTLQVMNRHGRAGLLAALLRTLVLRIEVARGQIEATATSVAALTAQEQAEVLRVAAALSGQQPLIEYRVDPAILGGLVLQIGGWRYDHSLRRQLAGLQGRLLERVASG